MKIVVFGLTITSSWGNGHATTYRSLLKALAARGHVIVFIEKDVEWYRSNRDLAEPEFCSVYLYQSWASDLKAILGLTCDADMIMVGSYFPDSIAATEALLEQDSAPILFYDIDTPITLAALRTEGKTEYLTTKLIPHFSAYLSFAGGPALGVLEQTYGARKAVPFLCSVDADLYRPTAVQSRFSSDLSYLGTYAPDRQAKLMEFLDAPAALLPDRTFRVAGPLYPADTQWHSNVLRTPHIAPPDHPAFFSSSRFTLNLTRAEMIDAGYSPSVRLFEASACGATILSDNWLGLDTFLLPNEEILIATSSQQAASILCDLSDEERLRVGQRARERILAEHTSNHRALQLETIVGSI